MTTEPTLEQTTKNYKKELENVPDMTKAKVTPGNINIVYTPGVAEPCKAIQEKPALVKELTNAGKKVLILHNETYGNHFPNTLDKHAILNIFDVIIPETLKINSNNIDKVTNFIYMIDNNFSVIILNGFNPKDAKKICEELKTKSSTPIFYDVENKELKEIETLISVVEFFKPEILVSEFKEKILTNRNLKSNIDIQNRVLILSNGTATLGLGDTGYLASLPVLYGKAAIMHTFANIDAFPLAIKTKDTKEIISITEMIYKNFGAILIEDIAAPVCFGVEQTLKKKLPIPVFHDDQWGTAIVTLAATINALKVSKQKIDEIKIVINGAGAAGIAIAKLLLKSGAKDIILCDRTGAIWDGRIDGMNPEKSEIAKETNLNLLKGNLSDVIKNANLFVGVSSARALTVEMVQTMRNPIIFAMANPIPEIMPDLAKEGGAKIVGTGRSDFPNQINNLLAFTGLFRAALDIRVRDIDMDMIVATAYAIAETIPEKDLNIEYIIPDIFNKKIINNVIDAVSKISERVCVAV